MKSHIGRRIRNHTLSIGAAVMIVASFPMLCPVTWASPAVWMNVTGELDGSGFGASVAALGDFDGDNFDDFAVSAASYGFNNEGRVYVYSGGNSPNPVPSLLITATAQESLGLVARGRDFDGNGLEELLVWHRVNGVSGSDRIRMFKGGAPPTGLHDWALRAPANFVISLTGEYAGIGDLNGDGRSEVAVSGYHPGLGMGFAMIYLGRDTPGGGADLEPDYLVSHPSADSTFGLVINHVGDISGDGIDDLAIGEPNANLVHVYPGTGDPGVFGAPIVFGEAVPGYPTRITSGDLDGDSELDLIVGAGSTVTGSADQVYVYEGGLGLDPIADRVIDTPDAGNEFGYAVAASKLYGASQSRLMVGGPGWDNSKGRAYFFGLYGGTPSETFSGAASGDGFAWSLAGGFDINNDNREDFLVGIPTGGPNNEGRVQVRLAESSGGGKGNFTEDPPGEGP